MARFKDAGLLGSDAMSLGDVSKVRHALIVSVKLANTMLRPENEGVLSFETSENTRQMTQRRLQKTSTFSNTS